jgi:hypothetical protein
MRSPIGRAFQCTELRSSVARYERKIRRRTLVKTISFNRFGTYFFSEWSTLSLTIVFSPTCRPYMKLSSALSGRCLGFESSISLPQIKFARQAVFQYSNRRIESEKLPIYFHQRRSSDFYLPASTLDGTSNRF